MSGFKNKDRQEEMLDKVFDVNGTSLFESSTKIKN